MNLTIRRSSDGRILVMCLPPTHRDRPWEAVDTGYHIVQGRAPGGWTTYEISPAIEGYEPDDFLSVHAALTVLKKHLEAK